MTKIKVIDKIRCESYAYIMHKFPDTVLGCIIPQTMSGAYW